MCYKIKKRNMPTEIEDYPDVRDKLNDLGCRTPSEFAILPVNFEAAESIDEFRQASEAATLKTLFRSEDIPYDEILEETEKPPYTQNNAFEWVAPTLFVSAAIVVENPTYVTIALNVVSNYATDFFKGIYGDNEVSMDIVVESSEEKKCKRISYEGPSEGLEDLDSVVKEICEN
jgi:hypothetical protein